MLERRQHPVRFYEHKIRHEEGGLLLQQQSQDSTELSLVILHEVTHEHIGIETSHRAAFLNLLTAPSAAACFMASTVTGCLGFFLGKDAR